MKISYAGDSIEIITLQNRINNFEFQIDSTIEHLVENPVVKSLNIVEKANSSLKSTLTIFQIILALVGFFAALEIFNSRKSRKKYETEIENYKEEIKKIEQKLKDLQKIEKQLNVVDNIERLEIIVEGIKVNIETLETSEANLNEKIIFLNKRIQPILNKSDDVEIDKIIDHIENKLERRLENKIISFEGKLNSTTTTALTLLKDRLNNFKVKYSDFFKKLSSEDEIIIPKSSKGELSFISSLTEIPEILSTNYFNIDELIFIGVAYYELGKYNEAINLFNKILKLYPTPSTYSRKGVALLSIQEYNLALECFNTAIKLNPSYYNAYFNKAKTLEILDNIKEARSIYLFLITEKYNKIYIVLNSLGILYFKQKKYDNALEHFLHSSNLKADYPNAYYNASLASYNLDDKNNGILYLQKAISINPKLFQTALEDNDFSDFLDERFYTLNPNK